VGHETAFISTNLMKNGMDAYALGDSEPGHNWLLISRCCFFLRLPWHCLAQGELTGCWLEKDKFHE